MATFQVWLSAFRLRTLPLALASIGMGSFLSADFGLFDWRVLLLCSTTTIFLQILSNLANDYGDSVHGADHQERQGPQRAVQSGQISKALMLNAIFFFTLLSFSSGIALLYLTINTWQKFLFFLSLGILSIIAAVTYTAGKKPYGYVGLGDISVFLFFGLVAVLGTFYLHTHTFEWLVILPAMSCGLFATAVLNINNIRDIDSDQKAGKKSIPVRIGRKNAIIYHHFLVISGLLCSSFYVFLHFQNFGQFIFLICLPLFFKNLQGIRKKSHPKDIDPYLKQMALTTLLFVLTFGIGQIIS